MNALAARPWYLFARSRRAPSTTLALAVLALLEAWLGPASVRLTGNESISIPWAIVLPCVMASIVGLGTRTPMASLERAAARSMVDTRMTHLAYLLALSAALVAAGSWRITGELTWVAGVRNVLGMIGLALITAWLLGGGLAWILPIAFTLTTMFGGASTAGIRGWAWPVLPDADRTSWAVAVGLAVLGTLLVGLGGTAESRRPSTPSSVE